MPTASILRVPVQIDGLFSRDGNCKLGLPMADFTKLPYYLDNGSTINTDPPTPNLAEAAFNKRLGVGPVVFPSGLHLHWALPDSLATGHHRGDSTQFPAVPNRWLVRRLDKAGALQKSWIVESDFLHPLDNTGKPICNPPGGVTAWPNNKAITFPTKRHSAAGKPGAAYRYMGRTLLLNDWLNRDESKDQFLNQGANSDYKLTALGYGEPAFAAYYPNCYSVFGICDVEADPGTSYEYQVIGWYHEAPLDPLQSAEFAGLPSDAERYKALNREYQWYPPEADTKKPFPARIVCFGSLIVTPNQVGPWPPSGKFDFAIGNTGGEALAALVADKIATPQQPAIKTLVEDQLEALNLAPSLQGVEVDYQAHFDQSRHQRGFRGVAGGKRWAVLPKPPQFASAADASRDMEPQPPLPDVIAHALDALNTAQAAYDMARQEITELRYQTFCDWHKFLTAYYSNSNSLAPFTSQVDALGKYIAKQPLVLLNRKIADAGTLIVKGVTRQKAAADGPENVKLVRATNGLNDVTLDLVTNKLTPENPANATLAVQVVLRLKALADALVDPLGRAMLAAQAMFNPLALAKLAAKLAEHYEIVLRPAENFWLPREPAILLSGPAAVSTPRHGEDGKLVCAVLDMPDAPGTPAFIAAVDKLKPAAGDPSLQTQTSPPWHPIILEWSIKVRNVTAGRKHNPAIDNTLDYEQNFITASFKLDENAPDLSPTRPLPIDPDGDTYEGRCLMTPDSNTQLDTNLRNYLIKATLNDCRDRAADKEADYLDRLIAWHLTKHNVPPPPNGASPAEKITWAKHQKPFVDDSKKDEDGNPILLPIAELLTWYAEKPVAGGNLVKNLTPAQQAQDPIYSAIRGLSQLGGMTVLSQALGGFNAALITREQVLQIPIEDPVGDRMPKVLRDLNLTANVAAAVGRRHPMGPDADKVFCPIRSGELTLLVFRLIDTFGQQWDSQSHQPLNGQRLVTSNELADPFSKQDNITYLPPRFSPPARLNFRWLAGFSGREGVDEVEMNSAPVTTPICGWLLPNHFDNSLMVYDNTGKALGSINTLAEWQAAPGNPNRLAAAEIVNPGLRRLVLRLIVEVGTPVEETTIRQHFLQSFLSTLDSAFAAIEPASFAQHEALALLIGRPVAVVRAQVDLQLQGHPTDSAIVDDPTIPGGKAIQITKSHHWNAFVDEDWSVFAYDWGQYFGCSYASIIGETCSFLGKAPADYARTTHGFEKVTIPIRLGEHQLLNDGLVGFWKERADSVLDNVFHAPQTLDDLKISPDVIWREGLTTPCIRAYTAGVTDNLSMSFEDDPLTVTILMDPRGMVHATCGILPVSKLEIPSVYYADALGHMGVTFHVSPVLTDAEQLCAALPEEPGYVRSWVTKSDGSTWEETSVIVDATEQAHFFKPKIVEGWLKLTPKETE